MKYIFMLLLCSATSQCAVPFNKYHFPMPIDKKEDKKDFEIPLTEDLMREHGILNRVLLIYEEIITRIDNDVDFSPKLLTDAATIIKSFIENYHEKLEEDYLFPIFEKNKKELALVKTLRIQHARGRKLTDQLLKLSTSKALDTTTKQSIKVVLQKFIKMYRPHEARENTILFPLVRSLMSEKEFKELSEKFEDIEHKQFGKNGFEDMVKRVETIEKALNIYNLDLFTPNIEK